MSSNRRKDTAKSSIIDPKKLKKEISELNKSHTKHFSPEYYEEQQNYVHELDEQVNQKLNNRLNDAPAEINKFVGQESLTKEIKDKLQSRFLDPIEALVSVEELKDRVKKYNSQKELISKHQQDAAQLQIKIAAFSVSNQDKLSPEEKQEIIFDAHALFTTIDATEKSVKDLYDRSERMLSLLNNLKMCVNKKTLKTDQTESAYASSGPTLNKKKERPLESQSPQEKIKVGPGKDKRK